MQKLLTIVVPVYKVEPYINKCLDSCVFADEKQMSQLEVIIVNDGTPDNSAEMSREYVKHYPQTFRQIDKENGGHGSAWNVGLKEATGKYLRFLDSDDWLTNLDKLMEKLATCDADIVFSDFNKFYSQENRLELVPAPPQTSSSLPLEGELLETRGDNRIMNFWYSTYKTEILKPLWPLFAEHVMYDDSILFFAPAIFGRTYESMNAPVYNYLLGREGQSVQIAVQQKNIRSYVKCIEKMEEIRQKYCDASIPQQFVRFIDGIISGYVHNFMQLFVHLPYRESKRTLTYLLEKYPFEKETTPKYVIRYNRMPFWLFYALEHVRSFKNALLSKN